MTMDPQAAAEWLEAYVAAWKTYDRAQIEALFSDDVLYRYHPYDDPIVGREAVVASWLGDGGDSSASDRDEPGTYDASYLPIAVDGDRVVATGISTYRESPDGQVAKVFHNCFVIEFDSDSACREFTEWFIQAP